MLGTAGLRLADHPTPGLAMRHLNTLARTPRPCPATVDASAEYRLQSGKKMAGQPAVRRPASLQGQPMPKPVSRRSETDKPAVAPEAARRRLVTCVTAALEKALDASLEPALYLVSTPIGNLADISLRALAVMQGTGLLLCEDTRHTRKLLTHFGISRELEPYHEHNAAAARPRILARLRAGFSVALVADAGTPLVSDPGFKLARSVLAEGMKVIAVPGASAALAALSVSGLASDRFLFAGFLPPKREGRRARLRELADVPGSLILFEAPARLAAMLADASEILGPREAAVARELTKLHEEILRGNLGELVEKLGTGEQLKGEIVVVVDPPMRAEVNDVEISAELNARMARASFRDAVREVADELGVHKSRVYRLGLALKEQETE
ncbi:MAG: 16S rRNA (cytidine(1402)-2'-O)-methyltransferase [Pseudomonadota bacterium]|nr:16S rRNA (cytidine(1402)-2'-O)-methyltransferase [Pseudomonadota bacterium]